MPEVWQIFREPSPEATALYGVRRESPLWCAFERREPAGWKSLHRLVWSLETKSNCFLMRGGGEQLEVNFWSVG